MVIIVLVTVSIVLLGQYDKIDNVASYLAIVLTAAVLVAAISLLPNFGNLSVGMVPQIPEDVDYLEILPLNTLPSSRTSQRESSPHGDAQCLLKG